VSRWCAIRRSAWESQIAREATIQIKPADGLDMERRADEAANIAADLSRRDGRAKSSTRKPPPGCWSRGWAAVSTSSELPMPRLVIVTIDRVPARPISRHARRLARNLPSASLDDHRTWVDRLVAMARSMVTIGMSVLALMLTATVLTVVFATRGAMAGAGHIIDVLHFVGAEGRFIARQFRHHFLIIGIKGASAGGLAAILTFIGFAIWSSRNLATPEADQATALFGSFSIGLLGYLGVALIALLTAVLTAATTHLTVVTYLTDIDTKPPEG
jgi:cell division transport system permease protein